MSTNITMWDAHWKLVHDFTVAFQLPAPEVETVPSLAVAHLRNHLNAEEYSELLMGLSAGDRVLTLDSLIDLEYVLLGQLVTYGMRPLDFEPETLGEDSSQHCASVLFLALADVALATAKCHELPPYWELPEALDALNIKIQMALMLTRRLMSILGFKHWDAAFREVHRSNMSKLDREGKPVLGPTGRVVKSDQFTPPDLTSWV